MVKRKLSDVEEDQVVVYCTGVCKPEAGAGIGIWFSQDDKRNRAYTCPGAQSEHRAQLIAVIMALVDSVADKVVLIRTDSKYVQQCVEYCHPIWIRNDSMGHVENHLVIQCLLTLLDGMHQHGRTIRLECVQTDAGTQSAQDLAFHGSMFPKEEDWDWETSITGYRQVFASEEGAGKSSKRVKLASFDEDKASKPMSLEEKEGYINLLVDDFDMVDL